MLAGQIPSTHPHREKDNRASPSSFPCYHWWTPFPGYPLFSTHLLFPPSCTGRHPVPYETSCYVQLGVGYRRESWVRTEMDDGISSPNWHVLVSLAQQTCHQLPALRAVLCAFHHPKLLDHEDRVCFLQQHPSLQHRIGRVLQALATSQPSISNALPQKVPVRVFSVDLKQALDFRGQPAGSTLHPPTARNPQK